MTNGETPSHLHFDEKLSFSTIAAMSIQHVLTIFPGTIAVPLILASALKLSASYTTMMIAGSLFTSGVTTFLQVKKLGKHIGSSLPLFLGSAFAPLSPMIAIGLKYDFPTVFGAVIASGILLFFCTFFMEKIVRFFPPIVVGSFITIIGITLAPTAFKDLAGGDINAQDFGNVNHFILGIIVLVLILFLNYYGKGMIKNLSILIALIFGTLLSIPMGLFHFKPILEAKWFELIVPFKLGFPKFNVGAILIMLLFCFVNIIQSFGAFAFLDSVTGKKTSSKTQLDGIRGQAFGQIISGVFSSFPSSIFNENISVLKLTGIASRSIVYGASLLLVFIGFSPKLCAIITCIPKPVIGGATLALFGTITAAGISILSRIDYTKNKNTIILGTSLALAVGANFCTEAFDKLPVVLSMLCSNGLFVVAFSSVVLNLVFNFKEYFPNKKRVN